MEISRARAALVLVFGAVLLGLLVATGAFVIRSGAAVARVGGAASAPVEDGCLVFPPGDPLNQEIANAPVSPNSANYVASIGLAAHLHPDFGTNQSYGIPYTIVGPEQPKVPIKLTKYRAESDPGPYPVPLNAPIEGGGRRARR